MRVSKAWRFEDGSDSHPIQSATKENTDFKCAVILRKNESHKKTLLLDNSKNSVICLVPEVGLEPT